MEFKFLAHHMPDLKEKNLLQRRMRCALVATNKQNSLEPRLSSLKHLNKSVALKFSFVKSSTAS